MRRRDEADIVAASVLQFEHHFGEAFVRDLVLFLLFVGLRDLVILAINTPKITVAEKNISGPICAAEAGLFAEMCGVTRDYRLATRVAGGDLIIQTVVAAVFRANGA